MRERMSQALAFIKKSFERLKGYIEQALPPNAIMPQAVLIFDSLLAFLSLFFAIYLRIGEEFLEYSPEYMLKNMFVFSLVTTSILMWMQTHKAIWRYISMEDMVPLGLAAILANIIFFPLMLLMAQQESLPRSIPLINTLVLIVLLGLPRFVYRIAHERHVQQKRRAKASGSIPVIVIGNGDETDTFIREVQNNPDMPYSPVALITTDSDDVGRRIHGVPILGTVSTIPKALKKLNKDGVFPKQIIITEPKLTRAQKDEIISISALEGMTIMHMLQHFSIDPVDTEQVKIPLTE
jgi:FlaA1/EpsC-like NDP-sugar epimerase